MTEHKMPPFFYEIFHPTMPRLGPGDDALTAKALDIVLAAALRGRPVADAAHWRVLDLGCGTGPQTFVLARRFDGPILAVDTYQPFLDEMMRRARVAGVAGKIKPQLADMGALTPDEGAYDLIWCEGALYCMGFREGLARCHRWLRPGGFMAVSELCWLTDDVPAECREFFDMVYPEMGSLTGNLSAMASCSYTVLDHFVQPPSAWWEPYFRPMEERLRRLRPQWASDPEKMKLLEMCQREVDIYRQYGDHYSNVLFVMQR